MIASSASISWGGSFSARPVSTTIRPAWLHHYLPRSPPLQPPHRPAPGQAAHNYCVSSWPPSTASVSLSSPAASVSSPATSASASSAAGCSSSASAPASGSSAAASSSSASAAASGSSAAASS